MDRKFPVQKSKHSRSDYSAHKTFRTLGAAPLPDRLLFVTRILNQGNTEHCTAYAATSIRESMRGRQYDPELYWDAEAAIYGKDKDSSSGVDLDTQMATGVKSGFVPVGQENEAPTDRASAYFFVTPNNGLDWFDSMRRAISDHQCPLSCGLTWYHEWDTQQFIAYQGNNPLGGHAIKIAGWDTINGTSYLVIQNSWGEQFGKGGLFYISREMANRVFPDYQVRFWSDDPNAQVRRIGLITALLINLKNLLTRLLERRQ